MLRSLVHKQIDAAEARLGVSTDYLRYLADHNLPAFLKFALLQPATTHRQHLPAEPYHAACLVTTLHEDCGTCVQIEVNLAQQAGVDAAVLQAVLRRDTEALSPETQQVVAYVQAVLAEQVAPDDLQQTLVATYGEAGFTELALAITMARVYPTMKRALGFAKSCTLVQVELEVQGRR